MLRKITKNFLKSILNGLNLVFKLFDLEIVRHSKHLYLLENIDLNPVHLCNKFGLEPRKILHIGGNTAQEASEYSASGVESVIYIEADPLIYSQMLEQLKQYPKFTGLNVCLSKDYGITDFFQASNNGGSSSILKPLRHSILFPQVTFTKSIKMKTIPLDSLNLGKFDLIVMDVQGAEHLVIEGGVKTFADATAIYLECSSGNLYESEGDLNSLVKLLDTNFTLVSAVMNSFQTGMALFISRQIISKLLKTS
jgi:FkbM family methyltransferase